MEGIDGMVAKTRLADEHASQAFISQQKMAAKRHYNSCWLCLAFAQQNTARLIAGSLCTLSGYVESANCAQADTRHPGLVGFTGGLIYSSITAVALLVSSTSPLFQVGILASWAV